MVVASTFFADGRWSVISRKRSDCSSPRICQFTNVVNWALAGSQLNFTSKLSDVVEAGIGNLVDADLAKESAKLQALQVKQQLGIQALSIANQAPQAIMSLFR